MKAVQQELHYPKEVLKIARLSWHNCPSVYPDDDTIPYLSFLVSGEGNAVFMLISAFVY